MEEVNAEIENITYLGYQEVIGDKKISYAQVRLLATIKRLGPERPDLDNGKIYERCFLPLDKVNDYLNWKEEQITQQTQFGKNIKDPDALFLSLQGRRINVRSAEKLVKKYAAYAAPLKKISPHKLRSTFGTALYRETKDIYVVADILGHRDVNTTKKHYAAISDEIRKNSANLIKLNKNDDN